MRLLLNVCIALSVGICIGFLGGAVKTRFLKNPSEKKIKANQKLWRIGSKIMAYCTGLLLILGLIWCTYFLIMAFMCPDQAEYADNMSELIVSVLTVISIIFAFYEFIRRKND